MSLFLLLPNQRGQVLAEVAVVAATLAVAAVLAALAVAALARRQLSMGEPFEEHRPSAAAAHTSPAEVLADQVSHLDSIMVVTACLPCGRRDSPTQSVRPQGRLSAGPPQRLGNQTVQAQLQRAAVRQIRGFRQQRIVSQIA